ncbi:MAG: glycosyltransferase [Casimicrobiaceae bacterium]
MVCTYNRAASLQRTLDSLAAQAVRTGIDWEVLVVDNNSKDDTAGVVRRFVASFPRARYAFEERQGLSFARNRGIELATGALILFTDDDVTPESDWVQRIHDGMASTGCDACGGFIAPVWETPPPTWLTERFHGFLAIKTERSDWYEVRGDAPLPYGANMAFRRDVFERFGTFDVNRGRKGNILASGEDGELIGRLIESGGKVMFFGDARVHHAVESFRLTKRYFRRWRYQNSRNLAESRGFPGARRVGGVPLYLFAQLSRAVGRAAWARLAGKPDDEAFFREIIAWHFLGSIQGLWRTRKASRVTGHSA